MNKIDYENKNIAIVIPAYNEAPNIPILLERIYEQLPHSSIYVVDDSNAKQARDIDHTITKHFPQVTHIVRKQKSGRGSAVLLGIKEALKKRSITTIIEMDADLAHDPADFPALLAKAGSTDLVIGSRYLSGSSIVNWPLKRLVLSKLFNTFLTLWLGLKLSDYTNGFRLYSRRAAEFLMSIQLRETGFIGLSEVAYRLKHAGFRIAEVPITFTDRKYGTSSADLTEHINALKGAIRIRLQKQSQALPFEAQGKQQSRMLK